jgi:hypothetical protein
MSVLAVLGGGVVINQNTTYVVTKQPPGVRLFETHRLFQAAS